MRAHTKGVWQRQRMREGGAWSQTALNGGDVSTHSHMINGWQNWKYIHSSCFYPQKGNGNEEVVAVVAPRMVYVVPKELRLDWGWQWDREWGWDWDLLNIRHRSQAWRLVWSAVHLGLLRGSSLPEEMAVCAGGARGTLSVFLEML